MNEILKSVAPTIATALLGPLAGAAVSFIAGKFGTPATQEAVNDRLMNMTAADMIQMKQMELDFQKFMMDNGIKLQIAQLDVDKAEAASTSIFVAGWRPAVGWICGAGLAYAAVVLPILEFTSKVVFGYSGAFPVIDWAILSQVLLGMLGLAGMRSFDKARGTGNGV